MFETYLIYNFILISGFFILLLASIVKDSQYKFLCFIVLLVMWVPAALRFGIGRDYFSYVDIFLHLDNYENIEVGYAVLMRLLNYAGFDYQIVFVVTSFITYLFCLCSFDRKNAHVCFLIYMCVVYLGTYSIVRQLMAMSILMYSIQLWISNKKGWSYFWLIISITVHSSMIFAVPLYILSSIFNWHFKNQLVIIVVTVLFLAFNVVDMILKSSIFAQTKYISYVGSEFFRKTEIGSGLGFIIKLSIPFALILMTGKLRDVNSRYNILFLFNLAYICSLILSLNIYIFTRLADVFSFSVVLSAGLIYSNVTGIRKVTLISLLLLNIIVFESNISIGSIEKGLQSGSGLGISPYNSIFYD